MSAPIQTISLLCMVSINQKNWDMHNLSMRSISVEVPQDIWRNILRTCTKMSSCKFVLRRENTNTFVQCTTLFSCSGKWQMLFCINSVHDWVSQSSTPTSKATSLPRVQGDTTKQATPTYRHGFPVLHRHKDSWIEMSNNVWRRPSLLEQKQNNLMLSLLLAVCRISSPDVRDPWSFLFNL